MECTSRVFVRADGISLLALRPLCAVVKLVLRFENTAQQTDPFGGIVQDPWRVKTGSIT